MSAHDLYGFQSMAGWLQADQYIAQEPGRGLTAHSTADRKQRESGGRGQEADKPSGPCPQ